MPSTKTKRGRPPVQSTQTGVRKGARLQISHTIVPDLLVKVDKRAEAMGQSRAAVINLAIYEWLEQKEKS